MIVLFDDLANAVYSLLNVGFNGLDIALAEKRSHSISSFLMMVMIECEAGGIVRIRCFGVVAPFVAFVWC
jgi:hypothetical protein